MRLGCVSENELNFGFQYSPKITNRPQRFFFYILVLVKNHFDGLLSAHMDIKLAAFWNTDEVSNVWWIWLILMLEKPTGDGEGISNTHHAGFYFWKLLLETDVLLEQTIKLPGKRDQNEGLVFYVEFSILASYSNLHRCTCANISVALSVIKKDKNKLITKIEIIMFFSEAV